jgi:myo-inositol-1(or 4)-monophosphatase
VGTAPATQPLSVPEPEELLGLARRLAAAAADVLRDRPEDLDVRSKSTPTDAVTVMDSAAERVILDGLARDRPDDAVVTEESADRPGSSTVTWYVDPLDGTVNYLYGLPQYAVSIAAEVDGELTAGVVVDVARGLEYTATRGGGARVNGKPLACSQQTDPALSLVATGFSYESGRRGAQAVTLTLVLPLVRDIRRFGSAALDLCAVASGTVDGYYEAGMHPWDWAAGALIAREAGARVDGLEGRPPGAHTTLAANPGLFTSLHDLLVAAAADAAAPDVTSPPVPSD